MDEKSDVGYYSEEEQNLMSERTELKITSKDIEKEKRDLKKELAELTRSDPDYAEKKAILDGVKQKLDFRIDALNERIKTAKQKEQRIR